MKINKSKVLIGSDFEMFLQNKEGKFISAIPFNKGTKANPEKIKDHKGCCIQHDGVLQECNVPPVMLNEGTRFWENINTVKDYINSKFAKKENLELVCCPTAEFEEDQLQDDEAKAIGCSADYNAWLDGQMNEKPCSFPSGIRSCGMHWHLSYPEASIDTSINLMKLFDLFLTIPFVIFDKDTKRRELYGKAGSFRLCEWGEARGFEARTLSNFALNSKDLIDYVFNQLNQMFDYFNENNMDKVNEFSNEIIDAINNSDVELAGSICEKFGILLLMEKELA
jgi:Phage phiEco32-like COOH.NH2 ligase-type 2